MPRSWSYAQEALKKTERVCENCGKSYNPSTPSQRWCNVCAPNRFFTVKLSYFGIGKPEYDAILLKQQGKCAICGLQFNPEHEPGEVHRKPYPCVDHDHDTSAPRGLICLRCNTRLGGQGDEVRWLLAALSYVIEHKYVLLDTKDPVAQPILWEYARKKRISDPEFSTDLEQALRNAGYQTPTSDDTPHDSSCCYTPSELRAEAQAACPCDDPNCGVVLRCEDHPKSGVIAKYHKNQHSFTFTCTECGADLPIVHLDERAHAQ